MTQSSSSIRFQPLFDQTLASLIELTGRARDAAGVAAGEAQDIIFEKACAYFDTVREFVDRPGNILGTPATKHGEIAEVAEVGVRNAWDVFNGVEPSASLDPNRIGPIDFSIGGQDVQSKFYNGVRNSLDGVMEHLDKYSDFPKKDSFYSIPKDQIELLQKALSGEDVGLSEKSIEALKRKVSEIEVLTGHPFADAVRPASFEYSEVQIGKIDETINVKEAELSDANAKKLDDIRVAHSPSWQGGLKAAGQGAGIFAAASFVRVAFGKYREGKNFFKGDFDTADWKDVGIETFRAAAVGGVTSSALYLMVDCAKMSAPLAGSLVSAVKGLAPLVQAYRSGSLSLEGLIDSGCIVCSEVAIVSVATAVGQAVIPIPILGGLIGSLAGSILSSILKQEVPEASSAISARVSAYTAELDAQQKKILAVLEARVADLGDLTVAAFDVALNADILAASGRLALAYGVDRALVLNSTSEVDRYMLD